MENEISDDEHADKFFKKEDLNSKEDNDVEKTDEDETFNDDEWVIGDKPPKDDVRVVFVRPKGSERRTRAS